MASIHNRKYYILTKHATQRMKERSIKPPWEYDLKKASGSTEKLIKKKNKSHTKGNLYYTCCGKDENEVIVFVCRRKQPHLLTITAFRMKLISFN